MSHRSDDVVKILSSPDTYACIATCSLLGSLSSRVSGELRDGSMLAFSGEIFPAENSGRPLTEQEIWDVLHECRESAVRDFNGLFSGAFIDAERGQVALFNDRYGSERVYVHERGSVIYFASEAKALLAVLPELRTWNEEGVTQYLAFGSTFGQRTLFSGISTLPGGSLWKSHGGQVISKNSYFDPSQWEAQAQLSESAFEDQFVETARSTIPNYYSSDARVGLSLTGGLDTRMILATLSEPNDSLFGYTYAAEDSDTLDVQIARQVSELLQLDYRVLRLSESFVKHYAAYVDRSIYLSDGTIGATGAHELYFTEIAQEISPIRLTGNFGSEVLRSMSTYKGLDLWSDVLRPEYFRAVQACTSSNVGNDNPLTQTVFREIPEHLYGPVGLTRCFLTFRTPFLDNAIVKLAYRAPLSSRKSTSAALRLISQGPNGLGEIPTDLGYSCDFRTNTLNLRRLVRLLTFKLDYWDKDGLPSWLSRLEASRVVAQRFGLLGWHKFLPYRRWFRFEFADYLRSVLSSEEVRCQPWWEHGTLEAAIESHFSGRRNCIREINAILTLSSIQRQFL